MLSLHSSVETNSGFGHYVNQMGKGNLATSSIVFLTQIVWLLFAHSAYFRTFNQYKLLYVSNQGRAKARSRARATHCHLLT